VQFLAEVWRRSEIIQALGDFSNLIREKSLIRRKGLTNSLIPGKFIDRISLLSNVNFYFTIFLYLCTNPDHYSAKVWALLGRSMTLAISQHTGVYTPSLVIMPLEIVFNKPHPSILIHIKDDTTGKMLILLLQKTKRDIIYHHAQLQESRRREELHP
jgi:hypothetical protein